MEEKNCRLAGNYVKERARVWQESSWSGVVGEGGGVGGAVVGREEKRRRKKEERQIRDQIRDTDKRREEKENEIGEREEIRS